MGIRIDGASDLINATDGSLTIEGQSINSTGIGTFSGGIKVGTAATIKSNGNATFSGIVTAASFVGDGSGLTNAGPSLTGSTNNTLVTVTGSNAIAGEATLTYDGTATLEVQPATATPAVYVGDSNRTGAGQHLAEYRGNWNGTAVGRMVFAAGADTTNKDDGRLVLYTATGGTMTEAFRIDENGKTTIGGGIQDQQASDFNSGANQLLITSNASTGLTIDATSSTSSSIHFADGSTGSESYRGIIEYNHSSDYMSFATGGTHRARIDSNGNLGIGTAAPGNLLHTYSASSDGIQFQSPSGQHFIYAIQSNDNLANGSLAGELGIRGKNGVAISGNNGTACQVHINSNGLCLGGTGAANGLDDYETGTFSMSVNLVNESYVAQTFYYVKIGSLVTWSGRLEWSGGNGTSDQILGLPFTVKNQDYTNNMTTNIYSNSGLDVGDADYLCAYHAQGNSRLNMTKQTTTAAYNLPGAANVYMTGFYYTDS